MKFLAVAAAFLASSVAAVEFTNSNFNIVSGQPFTLSWSGASGPVTITLKNGPASNLGTVVVIDSGDSNNMFSWTPPPELASGTYAFQITDSTGSNYSQQFTYSGNPTGTLGGTSVASITATGSTSGVSSATVSITTTGSSSRGSSSSSASATTSASTSGTTSGSTTTKTTATTTSTSASSSSSASASASKPPNSNNGQRVASPLAFIFVTVAALVYFS